VHCGTDAYFAVTEYQIFKDRALLVHADSLEERDSTMVAWEPMINIVTQSPLK